MWPFNKNAQAVRQALPAHLPSQVPQHPLPGNQIQPTRTVAPVMMERAAPQSIDVKAENIKSIIAQGEYFEGNLRFQRGIKIDGHVKGNVEFGITDGMLVVNDKARVEGDIYGPRAIVVGEVFGNIIISGRLVVLSTAKIHGDIAAGALQLHEGASIEGRICTVSDLQEKTHEHQASAQASAQAAQAGHSQQEPPADIIRFAVGGGTGR